MRDEIDDLAERAIRIGTHAVPRRSAGSDNVRKLGIWSARDVSLHIVHELARALVVGDLRTRSGVIQIDVTVERGERGNVER